MQRRYDIDALRVIAIFLLMFYHSAIVFQPWANHLLFPRSDESMEGLWTLMLALNIWRIPLLFVVSGVGFAFVIRQRTRTQLLWERTKRILIPAVFGTLFIVPVHYWLLLSATENSYGWPLNPAHLWFLFNIFFYVLVGVLPLYLLRDVEVSRVFVMVYSLPVLFSIEAVLIPYSEYALFAFTLHGLIVGAICFNFGFLLARSNSWHYLSKSGYFHLVIALTMYLLRVIVWDNKPPQLSESNLFVSKLLVSTEASLWLLSALGVSYRYLNKKTAWLTYLSPAVYPMYILHMIAMYGVCRWVLPTSLPVELQLVVVVIFTIGASYIGYRLIKPIPYLRNLFGMR